MALVNVVNMVVLDNPTNFSNPFQFEITFECLQELEDDLEWKVLYVGSAQDSSRDQVLDEILVGPVPVGVNKFVLQADAPDPSKLLEGDLLGVTVVLVTCSYKEREFVRVGYYVNNEYRDPNNPHPSSAPQQQQQQEQEQQQLTSATTMPSSSSSPAAGGNNNNNNDEHGDDDDDNDDDDDDNDGGNDDGDASSTPQPALPFSLPKPIPIEHIQRQILADKPRVTKFPISWGEDPTIPQTAAAAAPHQQQQQRLADESMMMDEDGNSGGGSHHPFAPSNNNNSNNNNNGMVDMPEESNASFSGQGGVQSMME